jgi:indole-3-glycerol phosphate synthase
MVKARAVRERRLADIDAPNRMAELERRDFLDTSPATFADDVRAGDMVTVIAEFKRRSPSGGAIAVDEDIVASVQLYQSAGARAVSVLTDAQDFGGSLDDLAAAAATVTVPVLRKDFLVDELDLYEAKAAGAAAVLLIVRMLERREIEHLLGVAHHLGLNALVEVHDESDLDTALGCGATFLGINNRDLELLTTDVGVTERLARLVPSDVSIVSESGIRTAVDVARVRDAGAHGVLVGESLMRLDRQARRVLTKELASVPR